LLFSSTARLAQVLQAAMMQMQAKQAAKGGAGKK